MNLKPNLRTFVPELWNEVDKFKNFYPHTHDLKPDAKKAVLGIKGHIDKALTLHRLAEKLAPNLAIDRAELAKQGFTPAVNAQEFSAVIEGVFTELYSSIDCARKVIVAVCKDCRRLPDSTRKLFARAAAEEIGNFPVGLQEAFSRATWYANLRDLRDELTHGSIGICHLSANSAEISYMHTGIMRQGTPLIISDVMAYVARLIADVDTFLQDVFRTLNHGLDRTKSTQILCGFFHGRGYLRMLSYEDSITLDSGVCLSKSWFDSEAEFMCPLAAECKAYQRTSNISDDNGALSPRPD